MVIATHHLSFTLDYIQCNIPQPCDSHAVCTNVSKCQMHSCFMRTQLTPAYPHTYIICTYVFCLCSYNVSRLEDWCHDNHLREAVEDQLRPIKEAAKLLQLRKATDKDALAVVDLCTHLSSLQVSAELQWNYRTLPHCWLYSHSRFAE